MIRIKASDYLPVAAAVVFSERPVCLDTFWGKKIEVTLKCKECAVKIKTALLHSASTELN